MILRRTEFAREDSTEGGRLASMLDEVRREPQIAIRSVERKGEWSLQSSKPQVGAERGVPPDSPPSSPCKIAQTHTTSTLYNFHNGMSISSIAR
jgi:hypothetical protein